MFQDLIESHDRLNQTPLNSSRPPASFSPWQAKPDADNPTVEKSLPQDAPTAETRNSSAKTGPAEKDEMNATGLAEKNERPKKKQPAEQTEKKKPGKQVGTQGHGRQVELPITDIQYHRACQWATVVVL